MRELILKMFISLDGFVGSTDGDNSWMINPDPVAKAWAVEKAWDTSLIVVGSRTFQHWAGYWPTATDEFSAPINQIPKAVFSRQGPAILEAARAAADKPGDLQPGAESWAQAYVASGDLAAEVAKLKAQDGKPMVCLWRRKFRQEPHRPWSRRPVRPGAHSGRAGPGPSDLYRADPAPAPHRGQLEGFSQRHRRAELSACLSE